MKARSPFRSLFTTTSVAALLATTSGVFSSGAFAGTSYNAPNTNEVYNSGGMTDFIEVLTTLDKDQGIDGLVVTGAGNGAYTVINTSSGIIHVTDEGLDEEGLVEYDGSLNGVYITDGAEVADSLINDGDITVEASLTAGVMSSETSLYRDAAGIRLDGNAADGIANKSLCSPSGLMAQICGYNLRSICFSSS